MHKSMATTTLTITVTATILAGVPLMADAETLTPTERRTWILEQNIAGGANFNGNPNAIAYMNQQIANPDAPPDIIFMEEVCRTQRDQFVKDHPTWSVYFSVMVSNQESCGYDGATIIEQGQILASPYPITNVTNDHLGGDVTDYPNGEQRVKVFKLLCGDVAIPGHGSTALRACVTHLRAHQTNDDISARTVQVKNIQSLLHDRIWTQGQAVILGGDFNMKPSSPVFDNIYRLTRDGQYTGIGDFYEADQTDSRYFEPTPPGVTCGDSACRTGAPTLVNDVLKYDCSFVSHNVTHGGRVSGYPMDFGVSGCSSTGSTKCSDHRLYRSFFDIIF